MEGNMTWQKARKLNAVFLLLLLATEQLPKNQEVAEEETQNESQKQNRSVAYFEEKLKEFERNKFRF